MSRTLRNVVIFLFAISMLGLGIYSWVGKNLGSFSLSGIITEFESGNEMRATRTGTLPVQGVTSLRVKSVNGKAKIIPAAAGSEIKYEATMWARGSHAEQKLSTMDITAQISDQTAVLIADHGGPSVSNEGVDFVVYLPQGIGLDLSLINGNVDGSLVVSKQRPVSVELTNGSIDLSLDATAGADITATLTNGKITLGPSDRTFDSILQTSRNATAKVNGGGTPVTLKTINGKIELNLNK